MRRAAALLIGLIGLAGLAALAVLGLPAAASSHAGHEPARIEFGRSGEGRELIARRLGPADAGRVTLVVGEIHGDEEAGRAVVRTLRREREVPRGSAVWTVTSVNPDGHEADTRTNARGVDLNRNFPFHWSDASPPGSLEYGGPRPFSEPESRAFADLVRRLDPDLTIIFHQPWNQVLGPCSGPARLQRLYARISGMELKRCRGEQLPGTATRWTDARRGTAFVVELGPGRLGSGGLRRHAAALRAVSR